MGTAFGAISGSTEAVWSLATPLMAQADSNRPKTRVTMVIRKNQATRPNVEIIGELRIFPIKLLIMRRSKFDSLILAFYQISCYSIRSEADQRLFFE